MDARRHWTQAFAAQLAGLARSAAFEQGRVAGWPMPPALAAHLWLYAQGLVPATRTDTDPRGLGGTRERPT